VIAWRETASARAVRSPRPDRDRAVDEKRAADRDLRRFGARPFTREEQQNVYLRPDGGVWSVSDTGKAGDFRTRGAGRAGPEAARGQEKAEAR